VGKGSRQNRSVPSEKGLALRVEEFRVVLVFFFVVFEYRELSVGLLGRLLSGG